MEWGDWVQVKYFMESDMNAWGSIDTTIHNFKDPDLTNILTYTDGLLPATVPSSEDKKLVVAFIMKFLTYATWYSPMAKHSAVEISMYVLWGSQKNFFENF